MNWGNMARIDPSVPKPKPPPAKELPKPPDDWLTFFTGDEPPKPGPTPYKPFAPPVTRGDPSVWVNEEKSRTVDANGLLRLRGGMDEDPPPPPLNLDEAMEYIANNPGKQGVTRPASETPSAMEPYPKRRPGSRPDYTFSASGRKRYGSHYKNVSGVKRHHHEQHPHRKRARMLNFNDIMPGVSLCAPLR